MVILFTKWSNFMYIIAMTVQTAKVENGKIQLPEELRSVWENSEVYITSERDRISIKRLNSAPLDAMLDELNDMGKGLDWKDIDKALRVARK